MNLANTDERNKANRKTFDDNIIKRSLIIREMYDLEKIRKGISDILNEYEEKIKTGKVSKDPNHKKYIN